MEFGLQFNPHTSLINSQIYKNLRIVKKNSWTMRDQRWNVDEIGEKWAIYSIKKIRPK